MGIVVGIPYYSNKVGLAFMMANLQPQMNEDDILYIVDDSPDKSGLEIANMYAGSRTIVLCEVTGGGKGIYNGWNFILQSMLENKKDGAYILNDDVVLSSTCISNLKKADKLTGEKYDALVTNTPNRTYASKRFDPNFKWFNLTTKIDDIKDTKWMPGFAFYLKRHAVERVGVFNTQFDVWYGDTEFENRLKRIGLISNEYVYHFGGSSYKYKSPEVQKRIDVDRILYEKIKAERDSIKTDTTTL
jgi:GT2 family glycosyltransferase